MINADNMAAPRLKDYIEYKKTFYDNHIADDIFKYLNSLEYEYAHYSMFGKLSRAPRTMRWVCNDPSKTYVFSQSHIDGLEPRSFTPELEAIKRDVEEETGQTFNAILINRYEDGKESIAWHSDNDPWYGPNFIVPSLSFGAKRRFALRRKEHHHSKISMTLDHGSLLLMKEGCQTTLEHTILPERNVDSIRFNLTFRNILPDIPGRTPSFTSENMYLESF